MLPQRRARLLQSDPEVVAVDRDLEGAVVHRRVLAGQAEGDRTRRRRDAHDLEAGVVVEDQVTLLVLVEDLDRVVRRQEVSSCRSSGTGRIGFISAAPSPMRSLKITEKTPSSIAFLNSPGPTPPSVWKRPQPGPNGLVVGRCRVAAGSRSPMRLRSRPRSARTLASTGRRPPPARSRRRSQPASARIARAPRRR